MYTVKMCVCLKHLLIDLLKSLMINSQERIGGTSGGREELRKKLMCVD